MLENERGYTGIEIAITVVLIFIFVSIISTLIYNLKSTSKEVELEAEALSIAVEEIEKVKSEEFVTYENYHNYTSDMQEISGKQGFFKTIEVTDYNEMPGNQDKTANLVKKVTVKISYKFKGKTQQIELSTVKSKEN